MPYVDCRVQVDGQGGRDMACAGKAYFSGSVAGQKRQWQMTDAKSDILQAVRSSLDLGEQHSASRVELVEKRISASEAHVQPLVEDPLIQRFCDKHAAVHGTYERVAGLAEVPSAILRHLTARDNSHRTPGRAG